MSLDSIVQISISTQTTSPSRKGFGVPLVAGYHTVFTERVRFYTDLPGLEDDGFSTDSPEYLAATAIMSNSPHPEMYAVGRAVGQPTQKYEITIRSAAAANTYTVTASGEGVTETDCTYTALTDLAFVGANSGDLFTAAAHGMATGDGPFRMAAGGPTGTAVDTNYWIIRTSADVFQIADTKAHAIALTAITISADGAGTLLRANNDTIVAQLVQALNAVAGKNYTAVQTAASGETDIITVTGTAAGDWFSLELVDATSMTIAVTHADPGVATDLAAITLASPDWYLLYTLYNSDAYVKAAAAVIETLKKIYIADVSDSETASLANGGGDLADDLQTSGYDRTAVAYHPSPAAMLGAGWLGSRLPYDPGSETWKFASPNGIASITTTGTHRVNLRAKDANTLQDLGGTNRMWEGTMASGAFIDTIRGLDWLEDDMLVGVFSALASALKIPYTNAGVALIVSEVQASLDRAIDAGVLSSDPKPVVTFPRVSAIADADKALRILPDIKWTAVLAGAIHRVEISGVVSV